MLSCGAALATFEIALRALGREPKTQLWPDSAAPELLASIDAAERVPVTEAALREYAAVFRRQSHRAPFTARAVPRTVLAELRGLASPPVRVRLLRPEETIGLAEPWCTAANALTADRGYQRELAAWAGTIPLPNGATTLPWDGLVRPRTHLPSPEKLAERIAAETVLVLYTRADSASERLRTGILLQRIWLTAISAGLVGSVVTQPLQVPHMRELVGKRLRITGQVQLLLRFGCPVTHEPQRPATRPDRARPG